MKLDTRTQKKTHTLLLKCQCKGIVYWAYLQQMFVSAAGLLFPSILKVKHISGLLAVKKFRKLWICFTNAVGNFFLNLLVSVNLFNLNVTENMTYCGGNNCENLIRLTVLLYELHLMIEGTRFLRNFSRPVLVLQVDDSVYMVKCQTFMIFVHCSFMSL